MILTKIKGEKNWTHHSVLRVDGSEWTVLAQMGGVPQHGRISRLNHRPGRAPRIRERVGICQGESSRETGKIRQSHNQTQERRQWRPHMSRVTSAWWLYSTMIHYLTRGAVSSLQPQHLRLNWTYHSKGTDSPSCAGFKGKFQEIVVFARLNFLSKHKELGETPEENIVSTDLACRTLIGRHFLLWRLGSKWCPD